MAPGAGQRVTEASVEKAGLLAGCRDVVEEFAEPGQGGLRQPAAVFPVGIGLPENLCGASCDSSDGCCFKDADPHLEIESLFDKNVLLGREEPEEVAATN